MVNTSETNGASVCAVAGLVCIYARVHHGYDGDLGELLDRDAQNAAERLIAGSHAGEAAFVDVLVSQFSLPSTLNGPAAVDELSKLLRDCWTTVGDSPHYDEFAISLAAPGQCVVHQTCMALSFAELCLQKQEWSGDEDSTRFFRERSDAYKDLQLLYNLTHTNKDMLGCPLKVDWSQLGLLTHSNHGRALARLMLCRDDSGRHVFELFDEGLMSDVMRVLGADLSWQEEILLQLTDQTQLGKFRQRFSATCGSFKRITHANARSIYHKATEEQVGALDGLTNEVQPDKLRKALEVIGITANRILMSHFRQGYLLECSEDVCNELDTLFQAKLDFHLTRDMAREVFATAELLRGSDYCASVAGWGGRSAQVDPRPGP